jgi:adenylate kinase
VAVRVVFMGPPGAGKGTQAQRIAAERGVAHVATGDMLRQAVHDGTPLGLEAKAIMDRGDLVPDDLMIGLIRDRLSHEDCGDGFILDGFPRTLAQAEALDAMLRDDLDCELDAVVVFDLDLEALVERISGRRVCRAAQHVYHVTNRPPKREGVCDIDGSELYQRDDDRPETVRARYRKQWQDAATPVVEYYRNKDIAVDVDAGRTPEKVAEVVDGVLDRVAGAA